MHTLYKKPLTLLTALALMTGYALADISLPLKPGYAVHTFGVSPDADSGDDHAVLRLYDTHNRDYQTYDNTAWNSQRPTEDFNDTKTYEDWTIEKIGNVYGIAIDKKKNIYVTASANWSPGYTGQGSSDTGIVPVRYGEIGGGENNISAAGTIYEINATTGKASPFAVLPQNPINITHQVCGNPNLQTTRTTGPGLGNIVYDKFHDQFFVSNFSDGKIYRIDANGNVDADHPFDTGLGGVGSSGSAYGLAISPKGDKLFFGTIEISNNAYKPGIFSVKLNADGTFAATSPLDAKANARLVDDIPYSQNIGGSGVNGGTWAAFSDLDYTPDGELLAGVRVGCENNFATSYNHGGVVYLLKKDEDGLYNTASEKTTPTDDQSTSYNGDPEGTGFATDRTGHSNEDRFDAGSIPLRPKTSDTQNELAYGPDDGYGGVAVWQDSNGTYDLYATSSDISTATGVHGFMQFSGDFNITDKATIDRAVGFKSVKSSRTDTNNESAKYDYKGIGGDVEVLSVVPVSVGSYVWEDTNKDGKQDNNEPGICGVKLHLEDAAGNSVTDIDGNKVKDTVTQGDNCTYHFDNLPEGKYRVCVTSLPTSTDNTFLYTKTPTQNGADDNDTAGDSNFMSDSNCSGLFSVFANSEPTEKGSYRGDDHDDAHDSWGNMTIDFGYVKAQFDLALIKTIKDKKEAYAIGDPVTFEITVKNQGDIRATNVKIKDTVPNGLQCENIGDDGILQTTISSIEPDAEQRVEINCVVTDAVGENGSIVNVAEIASADNPYDLNDTDSTPNDGTCGNDLGHNNDYDGGTDQHCDDVDPAIIPIKQTFDLALVKVVKGNKAKYERGEKVTFTIGITNQGTITGKNIQIEDKIPEGLELADNDWKLSGDKAILKTPIASLAPKDSVTRDITFKIKEDYTGGKITNIAEIASAGNDLNLDDNDSTPGDDACGADMSNNNDINSNDANKNGCDDVDPAWITVDNPNTVDSATENKSDTASADTACDCAGIEGNKVDAMSTWMAILFIVSVLMVGFLQSREEWEH